MIYFIVLDDSSEDSSVPPSRNRNNSAMASKAKRRQSLDPRAMKALNKAKTTAATKGKSTQRACLMYFHDCCYD